MNARRWAMALLLLAIVAWLVAERDWPNLAVAIISPGVGFALARLEARR